MRPPLHPESTLSQSTSCCSLRDTSEPVAISQAPSSEPVVENAQHEPHCPWFFTGVTAPLVVQSTEAANSDPSCTCVPTLATPLQAELGLYPNKDLYSSRVKSANWLAASWYDKPLAFSALMMATFAVYTLCLSASSESLLYTFPYWLFHAAQPSS